MTEDWNLPRLTPEELAEIQREVDEAPPNDHLSGPLPPLESDDPEWVAAWHKDYAEGRRGGIWSAGRTPRTKAQSGMLGAWRQPEAVVDVWCRNKLIARVVAVRGAGYEIVTGVYGLGSGVVHTTYPLDIASTRAVACKHGRHDMDSRKLLTLARQTTPGTPRTVRVEEV